MFIASLSLGRGGSPDAPGRHTLPVKPQKATFCFENSSGTTSFLQQLFRWTAGPHECSTKLTEVHIVGGFKKIARTIIIEIFFSKRREKAQTLQIANHYARDRSQRVFAQCAADVELHVVSQYCSCC
jgi:hypothetical protein